MKKYNYDKAFHFPVKYMNDKQYVRKRVTEAKLDTTANREAFERVLLFLYDSKFDHRVYRSTVKKYLPKLNPAERKIANMLSYRASGKERYRYGMPCVTALKKAKYRCRVCGERDVRCLEIDHVNGRDKKREGRRKMFYRVEDFQCLCANHHRIKTVIEKQQN